MGSQIHDYLTFADPWFPLSWSIRYKIRNECLGCVSPGHLSLQISCHRLCRHGHSRYGSLRVVVVWEYSLWNFSSHCSWMPDQTVQTYVSWLVWFLSVWSSREGRLLNVSSHSCWMPDHRLCIQYVSRLVWFLSVCSSIKGRLLNVSSHKLQLNMFTEWSFFTGVFFVYNSPATHCARRGKVVLYMVQSDMFFLKSLTIECFMTFIAILKIVCEWSVFTCASVSDSVVHICSHISH